MLLLLYLSLNGGAFFFGMIVLFKLISAILGAVIHRIAPFAWKNASSLTVWA